MSSQSYDAFAAKIYAIVETIPAGSVATYGQLALLAGRPRGARMAGRAMKYSPPDLISHRVVNSAGRLVPGWSKQRRLLENDGITFKPNGCVDMKKHRWRPY